MSDVGCLMSDVACMEWDSPAAAVAAAAAAAATEPSVRCLKGDITTAPAVSQSDLEWLIQANQIQQMHSSYSMRRQTADIGHRTSDIHILHLLF